MRQAMELLLAHPKVIQKLVFIALKEGLDRVAKVPSSSCWYNVPKIVCARIFVSERGIHVNFNYIIGYIVQLDALM